MTDYKPNPPAPLVRPKQRVSPGGHVPPHRLEDAVEHDFDILTERCACGLTRAEGEERFASLQRIAAYLVAARENIVNGKAR